MDGNGNRFLFPTRPAGDEAPFDAVQAPDTERMRVCSGFLRIVWAHRDKLAREGALAPMPADFDPMLDLALDLDAWEEPAP